MSSFMRMGEPVVHQPWRYSRELYLVVGKRSGSELHTGYREPRSPARLPVLACRA